MILSSFGHRQHRQHQNKNFPEFPRLHFRGHNSNYDPKESTISARNPQRPQLTKRRAAKQQSEHQRASTDPKTPVQPRHRERAIGAALASRLTAARAHGRRWRCYGRVSVAPTAWRQLRELAEIHPPVLGFVRAPPETVARGLKGFRGVLDCCMCVLGLFWICWVV